MSLMSCFPRHHFSALSVITHGWKNLCCISPLRRTWDSLCLNVKVCPIYLLYSFFFVSFHCDKKKKQSWIQLCTVSLNLPRKFWMLGMLLGSSATPYCICMALGNSDGGFAISEEIPLMLRWCNNNYIYLSVS